jgi:Ser/Thr protein kinase RdoA (MazF antagonist)
MKQRYDLAMVVAEREEIASVVAEFGLGEVLEISRMAQGNAPAYRVCTGRGVFLVKGRMDGWEEWAKLYRAVAQRLNAMGVRQAEMFATGDEQLIGRRGYAVFEFLSGDAVQKPDEAQFRAHVQHLLRYLQALRTVELTSGQIQRLGHPGNIWQKAASIDYLLDEFELDREALHLDDETESAARRSLEVLAAWRTELAGLQRQLVHSDIGPGNILYEGKRVVSIIDFTPAYEPALYAMCISLFWHCVFDEPDEVAKRWIAEAAREYAKCWPATPGERRCFFALMMRAAMYRLFARLIARRESGVEPNGEAAPFSAGSTLKMAQCVERVLRWEEFLVGCM